MAEGYNRGKLKAEQVDELRELFKAALADGRISSKELAQIQFFYYDSELSEADFSAMKDGVFKDAVNLAVADHHVSEQEEAGILRIAKQLNISAESKEWARRRIVQFASSPVETLLENE